MFIAFDGIDGSGKTTQAKLLSEYLISNGREVVLLDLGSSAYFKSELKKINNGDYDISPQIRELVYYFEALHTNINIIEKKRFECDVIIDRYLLTYFVYGTLNGQDMDAIKFYLQNLSRPDFYFFIDIGPEISLKRIKKYRELDIPEIGFKNRKTVNLTEEAYLEFQNNAYTKYLELIKENDVICINGMEDIKYIGEQVLKYIFN